jgi:hypothetical protein
MPVETLDYSRPLPPTRSRFLACLANVSLVWPLVYLGLLYGEWYLAWLALGHAPAPSTAAVG